MKCKRFFSNTRKKSFLRLNLNYLLRAKCHKNISKRKYGEYSKYDDTVCLKCKVPFPRRTGESATLREDDAL